MFAEISITTAFSFLEVPFLRIKEVEVTFYFTDLSKYEYCSLIGSLTKVKVELSLCLSKHHAIETYRGVEV